MMKSPESDGGGIHRRQFFQVAGAGAAAAVAATSAQTRALADTNWPVLKHYDAEHLSHIALPLGGIGTGTVSLYGNGSLRDWEIMNRPAKGFTPTTRDASPFFAIWIGDGDRKHCRVIEGPIAEERYEGSHGSRAPNAKLPRFKNCEFAASYPFGRVMLSDPALPVDVDLKAFNPMVPADVETSSIPVAALTYSIRNKTSRPLRLAICGSLPNFVGMDGWDRQRDFKGDLLPAGANKNRNRFRQRGLLMDSPGVDPAAPAWGSIALATTAEERITHRTSWTGSRWGGGMLDFWDDFRADGRLDPRPDAGASTPMGSLAVEAEVPAGGATEVTFLLAWHFPNRYNWTFETRGTAPENRIGNHYTKAYTDAWDVIEKTMPRLGELTARTAEFVRTFLESTLPDEVKEAALFNLSTLRTQTCFRTEDGRFYGWEGCGDSKGCCAGSCTHVWNYEQATAYLYGELAMTMREVEFAQATSDEGVMSFRVRLPLSRAQEFGRVAADGQMGCIMKMYRDWKLSGNDNQLLALWPKVRKALEFCWIPGGWDGDRDGVMEGIQHNTMDVEYLGPNPQMGFWYLGALRAAEEMARHLGEGDFATTCRRLYERGSEWLDANLFNGEYYEHEIRTVADRSKVPAYFLIGMGSKDLSDPDFQLGPGCLVDQLVGQFMAHVCGLGHLGKPENIAKTLQSIRKYNQRDNLDSHFNPMRTYALDGEAALLMAAYPKGRPKQPFPYFAE
ncbi:MAG: hypothetical protein GY953_48230, partial [bacterium]|nr:hypothetical protein [bacterium]